MTQRQEIYRFGAFRVDSREHTLTRDGRALAITPRVFATLLAFLQQPGRLLTKDELIAQVWPDAAVEEANLTVNVSTLRRLLDESEELSYIETVPRVGYRFVQAVSVERDAGAARQPVPAISVRAQELFARANQIADEADRWEAARDLYEACVQDSPGFAPAWARLARCHRLIAKFTVSGAVREHERAQAVRAFEQALAIEPELPLAHSLYAQLEVDLGLAPKATVRLLASLDRQGPTAAACSGLVHALRFCGLLDASRTAHDRARALDPAIATSVAHTCWQLGDYETALAETTGDIGYIAGLALASMGRFSDAIAALRWRERDTRDNRARAFLVSLRAALEGDADQSVAALQRAEPVLADPEGLYYIARTYAKLGITEAALDRLAQVLDQGYICYPALLQDAWLERLRQGGHLDGLTTAARTRYDLAQKVFTKADGERLLQPMVGS
jgi:DNA-binding winged helix-turn-helix (wHTH) protein